jgi:Ca-activated chloride channel homolog
MFLPRTFSLKRGSRLSFGKSIVSRFILLSTFFAFLFLGPRIISGQAKPEDEEVLSVTTDLLVFTARIRHKRGEEVRSLTEKDLSLKDEDQVTSGLYFSPGVDRVAMVFALDQSGSLREIISQQSDAALGLYQRFSNKSSIAVLQFAASPIIAAAFDRDPARARAAFNLSVRANERTAIFDAAEKAVAMLDSLPRIRSERRIAILISDGLDNASRAKPDRVISFAREKRVSFYVIHLPLFEPRDGRLAVRRPAKGFRELAEKTGGKYFLAGGSALSPADKVDLAPIFKAIEDDLKSQYLIGFYLNEKANDGRRHTFSLALPDAFEYQVGSMNYARSQKFFVERPREFLKNRK